MSGSISRFKTRRSTHPITNRAECCSELLNQALALFEARPTWYRNERARTKYKLGCVLQDAGKMDEGSRLINEAEELRREIIGPNVLPGNEREFDRLVMFWSR